MTSQTPDTQVFLERLERLERQYRRLKRTGVTGLTAIAALVLMAQATPKSRMLETQELVLRDSSGKIRASFGAYRGGPKLTLNGEGGEKLAELFSGPDGSALTFFNQVGLPQTTLRADKTYFGLGIYSPDGKSEQAGLFGGQATPMLALLDQHHKPRAVLSMEPAGPQLVLTDDDGKPRFGMLVRDGSPLLQAEDANGKVTWSAPENTASIAARLGNRPRVFIEALWKPTGAIVAGSLNEEYLREFERNPMTTESRQRTNEQMAAFAQVCPGAVATIDQQKADYRLHLDTYYESGELMSKYSLLGRDGDFVAGTPTAFSAPDTLNSACKSLLADWGAKNFRADVSTVVIKSTPDGADITVNGKFAGVTPSTLKLPPGDYEVRVQKSGFRAWNRTVTLSSGASISVDATLEKGP